MPVTHFRLQWPDDSIAVCYSPSSIVRDYFTAGQEYPLDDFLTRARQALGNASDRVKAKYGYFCSSATDQLAVIEAMAERFGDRPDAKVRFLDFDGGSATHSK